jgi:pyruvate dehydrogenase E1 component
MDIATLEALERKILWLSSQIIHNANHERDHDDGLKVGGHQASSASLVTIMTALYLHILRPEDRVAVKPHASPVFHAIQYLLGNQKLDNLLTYRGLGGAQSYPSRTKDADDVDFSTGSVGLGAAVTAFASLTQDYLRSHDLMADWPEGRMVALIGDAELDEGNIFECLLEGWKHDVRNCWWIIDYNRQSLDSVVNDQLFQKHADVFRNLGWGVITLKYGNRLRALFEEPGGNDLQQWIDECPNQLYSALVFQGGAAWRKQLETDLAGADQALALVASYDDETLHGLMTNLGGHCMESVVKAFEGAPSDRPVCFIAYTVKGYGLPLQGHKDNHAGIMTKAHMEEFRERNGIIPGQDWEKFSGMNRAASDLEEVLSKVPFNAKGRRRLEAAPVPVEPLPLPPIRGEMSTQEGFGKILGEIARTDSALAQRIVTTSPDVTVSTNLGAWVNRRAIYSRDTTSDVFRERKLMSAQVWDGGPHGQHIELGIAENNLFLNLAALGLSHTIFGERLIPIGTLYDPFIARGLDALNYACYQDARFILVATPSGISLGPEGGAHQSIGSPLIGMAQDGLAAFEPTYVDELAVILEWAFEYVQRHGGEAENLQHRDASGGSVYLRLSTRPIAQIARKLDDQTRDDILTGGYWMRKPSDGCNLVIAYTGVMGPEAADAMGRILDRTTGAGLLAVTSADRLYAEWSTAQKARHNGDPAAISHVEKLLAPLARDAQIVTVIDGHPTTLSWLGSVHGHRVQPLGVDKFGQTGTLQDLYHQYGIDADAIVDACRESLPTIRRTPLRQVW